MKNDLVKLHYIGGDSSEDEWIAKCSQRLRPSQSGFGNCETANHDSTMRAKVGSNGTSREDSSGKDQRPVRRSRMISDDARLALQLHEAEMKAAKGKRSFPRKHNGGCNSRSVAKEVIPAESSREVKISEKRLGTVDDVYLTNKKAKVCRRAKEPSSTEDDLDVKTQASSAAQFSNLQSHERKRSSGSKANATAKSTNITSEEKGMVSFSVLPDESDGNTMPSLKCSNMCLMEDLPVGHITRLIVDELMPGKCIGAITIRTASGALVGQDHSLRFVRTFLWPRSKGDLVLKYSLSKSLLL